MRLELLKMFYYGCYAGENFYKSWKFSRYASIWQKYLQNKIYFLAKYDINKGMLFYLCRLEEFFGPFRLFRYVTFRGTMAFVTALLLLIIFGPKLFAWLRAKNVRDVIRTEVLSELRREKKDVPTMGGLGIVFSVVVSCLLWLRFNVYDVCALSMGLLLCITGIVDDWLKIRYHNAKGIASHWKWFVQGISTLILLYVLLSIPGVGDKMDSLYVTFFKNPLMVAMPPVLLFFYWFCVIAGTSNASNLTDGMDGLAIGCTVTVTLTYAVFSYVTGNIVLSQYLHLPYINGVEELSVICLAITGASIGFLWYNAHPAEIFMGDTGSLALGAWIGTIALMTQQATTLIIVGGVFVMEALSVILQVTSYKLFRKRCFKMCPIHHHFEFMQIPESKIVVRFWIIALLCALMGLVTLKLR